MDQAVTLRRFAEENQEVPVTRVISVSSGKGGVGKTNSVINLAIAFSRMGKKVLLLDADLGLGNLDVLLGLAPRYNMGHLLRGEKSIGEVLVDGPEGISILPASSGVQELTSLSAEERLALASHLEELEEAFDIMIIDTGAGISSNVLFFNVAAQEIMVVVTPEPTSITDAYALMKVLLHKHGERRFKLLVNEVKNRKEGIEVYRKISLAAERFLSISVEYVGCVLLDENVHRSVIRQKAVMELYPESKASQCYQDIAKELCASPAQDGLKGGMQFFWKQFLTRNI
ncbi:MAG TPA: flagellar synthesis regulator FleN [Deltaproteobacteria bacterium]|nr:MAG: flagellar synthesis regulator FleN [Deltaproteobacteria bacterium GWA2_55_82]OGQ62884.1 MAG: flagellar synthesis regulator FleN [Deltaproteobacteria bacterium RIFCSPLOWO2_02_FULL_55_12]OIJ72845.1 MAG: flagellar synthesis regulator FleN [Deltaproteobacteria bacterium GWC2_55_46]HBG46124.1 flagellar synthesis regulator FleN [Deltaproteobacteria bacterium]HCY11622.1 flagellar synthesis regulator FleN [Deltaproteobacteria bacterium]